MCAKCVEAVNDIWGLISDQDASDLLWNATCFPFGEPEMVRDQLQELYQSSRGSVPLALHLADLDMERSMKKYHGDSAVEQAWNNL